MLLDWLQVELKDLATNLALMRADRYYQVFDEESVPAGHNRPPTPPRDRVRRKINVQGQKAEAPAEQTEYRRAQSEWVAEQRGRRNGSELGEFKRANGIER
jgi:hypothetical protein